MQRNYEFAETALISAIAVGVPGKRTFFLAIGEKEKWIRLWLEKEHLEVLALAIDQLLHTLAQQNIHLHPEAEIQPLSSEVPSGLPAVELEIEQIALGYEQESPTLRFLVHGVGPLEQDPSEVHCRITMTQLLKLGDQAKSICAAGRPRCPICGGPIDPSGHICPKTN